jgi:two-component system LytT family sensor kinase
MHWWHLHCHDFRSALVSPIWNRIRGFPWRLIFLLNTAFGVFLFFYKALDRPARNHPIDWLEVFLEEMTGAYSGFPLLPLVAWLVLRFPVRDGGWKRHWPLYSMAGVAYGVIDTTLIYGLRLAVFAILGRGTYDYGIMSFRYLMELPVQLIIFSVIVVVITYAEDRRLARERQLRMDTLERQLAQAQLETLQLQLRPHFLFNALNAVSSIMYDDPRAADRMIGRLSEFLRRVLRTDSAHEVPLREELDLLELYLDIMRARFEHRLQCSVESDRDLESAMVPQLILQPVVENAIRYGADPTSGEIRVTVQVRRFDGRLRLEVNDCGPGTNTNQNGLGLGLKNLAARLERLYGARGQIAIEHHAAGTRVLIWLPLGSASQLEGSP